MFLQKLEIQGFKSFANKTTLEFNKDLTAVVGPNGSGKSNIADAVRWVLGEQSLKVLRGKKSQDVIFAGSDKKTRLGMAEVNLYLNNEDGKAPIDYKEVVISRRIYRNGETEYLINKNKVRLSDIQMLMAKSSFGQRSYSIVGQGMVESILTSSPQERKEFFDEATGVRQYQIKREQSLNKLEKTYENLQQSEQLLKEIEPRLKSLTRSMKRLEEKAEAIKELDKLQNEYYGQIYFGLTEELDRNNDNFKTLETTRRRTEEEISQIQQSLDKIEAEDSRTQSFRAIEDKYSQLVGEKNRLLQEISLLQGKIDLKLTSSGQANIVWLQKKSQDLSVELTSLQEQLETVRNREKEKSALLEEKTKEQSAIVAEFDNIRDKLLGIQKNVGNDDNLTAIHDKVISLKDAYKDFMDDLDRASAVEEINELKETAKQISILIQSLNSNLKETSPTSAQEIVFLEEKMNQFLTSKDNLVDEINQIRVELEIAKTQTEQVNNRLKITSDEKEKIDNEITANTQDTDDEKQAALQKQKKELQLNLEQVNASLELAKQEIDNFNNQAEAKQGKLIQSQKKARELQITLNDQNNKINQINIEIAKIETKLEDLNEEIKNEKGSDWSPTKPLAEIDIESSRQKIVTLKNKLALIGGIDQGISEEYEEVKERFNFLDEQCSDLNQSITTLQDVIQELDEKIEKQFETNFTVINDEFKKYFNILFSGGKASLTLNKREEEETDEEEEKEEISPIKKLKKKLTDTEIEIKASPPGKKIDTLSTLSGGEKAMTAIALICAIISSNPSPFVILDEVDAALDEANAGRYVAIINELSDKTQFIAVTHNRVTMHHASILYGVTMGNDSVSRLLSINLKEAETYTQ
ncbi:MAG: chromosome segregation SMC family protein [Candidatus Komeilibacteria bacterium]